MRHKRKVLISGYYGFDNSGDDAILKAIVKDFKDSSKDIEITALSSDPDSTRQNYGIRAVNRFNLLQIIRAMYSTDLFISGGGSLLQDITSTRSIIYYISLIYLAKLFNKPVMVYANGIGPINKRYNRLLTRKVLDRVDVITLRDFNSRKTLKEIGVTNKNVYVTSDPVFTLKPASQTRVNNILEYEGIPADKPLVGISVRKWKGAPDLEVTVSKTIDYLTSHYQLNILLIPMHFPDDLKISTRIMELSRGNCYIISNKYTVEELMGIISRLELIIAMRLHSLIYAATQAVPMVGLVYDPKVEGFLDLLGLNTKCDVPNLELVDLCTVVDRVWNNRKQIKSGLIEIRDNLEQKALENVKMALNLLRAT